MKVKNTLNINHNLKKVPISILFNGRLLHVHTYTHTHTQKTHAYNNVHIFNKDELLVGAPCTILDYVFILQLSEDFQISGELEQAVNFLLFVVKRDLFIISNTSLAVPVKFHTHPANLNQRLLNL